MMPSKRRINGHHAKVPRGRSITLTWSCGCQTKVEIADREARSAEKKRAARETCDACRREELWQQRRDVGVDDEDLFDLSVFGDLIGAAP